MQEYGPEYTMFSGASSPAWRLPRSIIKKLKLDCDPLGPS